MTNQPGPQPGQGHQWGPQQTGQHSDERPQAGQQAGHQPPSGQQNGPSQQTGQPQQGGQWGQPGPYAQQPGYPHGSGAPQHQGQPGTGAPQQHGAAPQFGQTAPAGTATPVAGSSEMSSGQVIRIVLHGLALVLVVLGISLDLDDRGGALWGDTWTWAGFATLLAVLQLGALLPRTALSGAGWTLGAVGAGGLLLFWTLLMLPAISTNMAFLVTLGTACAVAAVLLSPDRKL